MAYKEDSYYIEQITRSSDQVALAHLIRKHQTMVYNIAKRITRSSEDAEEVTQDTFLKVFNNINQFKGDAKFTTWLYRIAWNLAVNKTKKKSHITASTDDDFTEKVSQDCFSVIEGIENTDKKRFLKMAIDSLEEQESAIVTLYYMDDHSVDEIVDITSLSASNVKVKLYRARKKIEVKLSQLLDKELHLMIG